MTVKSPEVRPRRGSYARGRATKENILRSALDVVGRNGYGATILRDIADEVGMTQAGLLHHFDTKEKLLAEVLRKRDEVNREILTPSSDLDELPLIIKLAHHNVEVPGLVQLYVRLQAEAVDPEHPSHEYFLDRDVVTHSRVTRDIERRQKAGLFDPEADAAVVARMLLALSDGLQSQWAIDPTIDLPGTVDALWNKYARPSERPAAESTQPN